MRKSAIGALVLLITAAVGAGDPAAAYVFDLFDRPPPQPPVAGDCAAIAAKIGPEATWYGEFAGSRHSDFRDFFDPFSARGCFRSEFQCRAWQNTAITYLGGGPVVYTFCRQGLGDRY
jgi:hypothetical protein